MLVLSSNKKLSALCDLRVKNFEPLRPHHQRKDAKAQSVRHKAVSFAASRFYNFRGDSIISFKKYGIPNQVWDVKIYENFIKTLYLGTSAFKIFKPRMNTNRHEFSYSPQPSSSDHFLIDTEKSLTIMKDTINNIWRSAFTRLSQTNKPNSTSELYKLLIRKYR